MNKEIGIYIDRTYKVVRQDLLNRFMDAGLDLTPEQWVILSKLQTGEMNQTDLAQESFKDAPTVSRIINLLLTKGFVSRTTDPEDGRRYLVSLTPKGKELIDQARPYVMASRSKGWENLSEAEYDQLLLLLDKVFRSYS